MIRFISMVLLMHFFQSGFSQNLNKIILDEKRQMDILVGEVDMDGITGTVFGDYYAQEFDPYQPDEITLNSLRNSLASDFQFTIVLGTWCSDSQREVPRMLKVLSEAGVDYDKLKLYGVDSYKEAEGTPVASLNIEKVPTLIIFRAGIELGRIIETPVKSIEKDVLGIVESY